jgi:hypothetical protein
MPAPLLVPCVPRAFHRLPQRAVRPHVRAVRPCPKQRLVVRQQAQVVRPPWNRVWQSECEPRRSDHPPYRGWWSDRVPMRSNRQAPHNFIIADFAPPRVGPTTSTAPHAAPSTPPAPCMAPASTTLAAPPAAPAS